MNKKLSASFYWFRSGQFISSLGSMAGYIAMSWWIIEKTGSPAALGVVLAIPMFLDTLLEPLLAPLADKYSRKKLSIIGDTWSGVMWLVIALYAFTGHFSAFIVGLLYVINVFGASLSAVAGSVLPRMLVEEDQYETAMRQTVVIGNISAMIGGLVGGAAAQLFGSNLAFAFNGITFFIAALCSAFIKKNTVPIADSNEMKIHTPFIKEWSRSLGEGVKIALGNKILLKVVILAAGIKFFEACFTLCLPILVKEGHGMPESYFGLLRTSSAIGVILATILFARINKKAGYVGTTIIGSAMFTSALILIPFSSLLILPFIMMFIYGFGDILSDLPLGTRLGTKVPVKFQARVFSILGLLSGIAYSLGAYSFGFLVEALGLTVVMVGAGIACGILLSALFIEGSLIKLLNGCNIFEEEIEVNSIEAPEDGVLI